MDNKFEVFVNDNYHYARKGARSPVGTYDSFTKAIEKCKQITIASLEKLYQKGMTAAELRAQWSSFGEDPYIRGADDPVPFSATEFVDTKLCEAVIAAVSLVDPD